MTYVPPIRDKRDSYEFIGPPVTMFDISLDPQAASDFRDYVAQVFLPSVLPHVPERPVTNPNPFPVSQLSESHDKTLFRVKFGYDRFTNPDADMAHFTAFSLLHYAPNAWKFTGLITRYPHDITANKITVRHHINMDSGRLFDARREVRIIRSNDTDTDEAMMHELEQEEPSPMPAKFLGFERPLANNNLSALREHLQRVAKRIIASA